MVETKERELETRPPEGLAELAHALAAGVLILKPDGSLGGADEKALALLACRDKGELGRCWEEVSPLLAAADPQAEAVVLPAGTGGRPLLFEIHRLAAEAGSGGTVLLVRDPEPFAGVGADLRLATYQRTLSQVSPAVAHDLRAPINAMVFNIEILKETISAARAMEPAARERQLRYVGVLKEELSRLHGGLEHFLAHTSGRGDRPDSFDLREAVQELAALLVPQARKLQVQVVPESPDSPVLVSANRYQLRQALLEIGLSALSGVARAGVLSIRLAKTDSGARIVLSGPLSAEAPALDFELAPGISPAGSARLYHARTILAEQGGRLEVSGEPGGPRSFEVELTGSGKEG